MLSQQLHDHRWIAPVSHHPDRPRTPTSAQVKHPSIDYAKALGNWQLDGTSFPPFVDDGSRDLGPYTVTFDAETTVTSWDVEAYGTRISKVYGTATPSPTTPTVPASASSTP